MKLPRARSRMGPKVKPPRPRPGHLIAFVAVRGTLGAIELMLPELATRWSPPGLPLDRQSPEGQSPESQSTGKQSIRLDRQSAVTIRILGGRQVFQAALMYLAPGARVAAAGAVVDSLHAASMLALAVLSPRWRRPALAEAVAATALAGIGVATARSLPARGPGGPVG